MYEHTVFRQIMDFRQMFRSCWILRPQFRVAHTKRDVINILLNKDTFINMYIIKKIILVFCKFILCWDITALLKLKWKFEIYV